MIDAVIEELKTHQTQLDQDGVMVGVSRQALEELLAHVAAPAHPAPIAGLEPVAWRYWWRSKYLTYSLNEPRPDDAEPLYTRAQLEAHAAERVEAEREACAAEADRAAELHIDSRDERLGQGPPDTRGALTQARQAQTANAIADAIRARGQQ